MPGVFSKFKFGFTIRITYPKCSTAEFTPIERNTENYFSINGEDRDPVLLCIKPETNKSCFINIVNDQITIYSSDQYIKIIVSLINTVKHMNPSVSLTMNAMHEIDSLDKYRCPEILEKDIGKKLPR